MAYRNLEGILVPRGVDVCLINPSSTPCGTGKNIPQIILNGVDARVDARYCGLNLCGKRANLSEGRDAKPRVAPAPTIAELPSMEGGSAFALGRA